MAKPHNKTVRIGRLGAPANLRAGGAMESANRKRDTRRGRKAVRVALRQGTLE